MLRQIAKVSALLQLIKKLFYFLRNCSLNSLITQYVLYMPKVFEIYYRPDLFSAFHLGVCKFGFLQAYFIAERIHF